MSFAQLSVAIKADGAEEVQRKWERRLKRRRLRLSAYGAYLAAEASISDKVALPKDDPLHLLN